MKPILVVVPDLFFAEKIAATARGLGVELAHASIRDAARVARERQVALVLLDLHATGGDPLDVPRSLSADPTTRTVPVVGFYSHVDGARREAARFAGVHHVLPRSAFATRLADILSGKLEREEPTMTATGRLITEEADLTAIVRAVRTVAVVGAKSGADPDAPAYSIPLLLQRRGLDVVPINPTIHETLGVPCLRSVGELERAVDVLDVFRRPDALPALADEILAMSPDRRPRCVWLQTGIRHDDVAERLRSGGMDVVQDRCLGVYVQRYR